MADDLVTVDARKALARLEAKAGLVEHPKRILRRFHVYMVGQTGQMFRENKHGGTHRGVHWPWFADQYTRKTDGVTVPAEGGVPKLRGKGKVKGRLRVSGAKKKRTDKKANLMALTGTMKTEIGTAIKIDDNEMVMGTSRAYIVEQDKMRKALFFTDEDLRRFQLIALEQLEKEVG